MKKLTLALATAALIGLTFGGTAMAQTNPPIVLTAFGTSTKARVTFDVLEAQVRKAYPDHEIRWAFTSSFIRRKVNRRNEEAGDPARLLSLQEALTALKDEGFKAAAVQPLHIFPGLEYQGVVDTVAGFDGLRIETGETLLQRWDSLYEVVHLISKDFLPPEEGCNVVVAHGTPTTDSPANIAYLGLERHLHNRYENVYVGDVDGVLADDALAKAATHPSRRVRFVTLMYVAGDHTMNDIMGQDEQSWKSRMEAAGFGVDAPTVVHGDETHYKGLGFIPEVNDIFIGQIRKSLGRLKK